MSKKTKESGDDDGGLHADREKQKELLKEFTDNKMTQLAPEELAEKMSALRMTVKNLQRESGLGDKVARAVWKGASHQSRPTTHQAATAALERFSKKRQAGGAADPPTDTTKRARPGSDDGGEEPEEDGEAEKNETVAVDEEYTVESTTEESPRRNTTTDGIISTMQEFWARKQASAVAYISERPALVKKFRQTTEKRREAQIDLEAHFRVGLLLRERLDLLDEQERGQLRVLKDKDRRGHVIKADRRLIKQRRLQSKDANPTNPLSGSNEDSANPSTKMTPTSHSSSSSASLPRSAHNTETAVKPKKSNVKKLTVVGVQDANSSSDRIFEDMRVQHAKATTYATRRPQAIVEYEKAVNEKKQALADLEGLHRVSLTLRKTVTALENKEDELLLELRNGDAAFRLQNKWCFRDSGFDSK